MYLWNALTAFGFSNDIVSLIKVLYTDVESVLKMNGNLCAPFKVFRGIRQGCALAIHFGYRAPLKQIKSRIVWITCPKMYKCFYPSRGEC